VIGTVATVELRAALWQPSQVFCIYGSNIIVMMMIMIIIIIIIIKQLAKI